VAKAYSDVVPPTYPVVVHDACSPGYGSSRRGASSSLRKMLSSLAMPLQRRARASFRPRLVIEIGPMSENPTYCSAGEDTSFPPRGPNVCRASLTLPNNLQRVLSDAESFRVVHRGRARFNRKPCLKLSGETRLVWGLVFCYMHGSLLFPLTTRHSPAPGSRLRRQPASAAALDWFHT